MDLKLQDITVPAFIWYVLPGLNFVLVVVGLPVLLAEPTLLAKIDSLGGAVLVIVGSLVIGFVMDSLKLYRFDKGYHESSAGFMESVGGALGISGERMRALIDPLRMGLNEHGAMGRSVAFNHSRWVMMSHSAKCFYGFAVIWTVVFVVSRAQGRSAWYLEQLGFGTGLLGVVADLLLIGLAVVTARRLSNHTADHRDLSNQSYMDYVGRFRSELRRDLLGLSTAEDSRARPELATTIATLRTAAQLKTTRRAGWVRKGLKNVESVADHTFMLCQLAFVLAPRAQVDRDRAVALALIHDLPEAIVGDMLPGDPRRPEKGALEADAMQELVAGFADASLAELWREYERAETAEARFVHELDKIEMALQASIYERADAAADVAEFFATAEASATSALGKELMAEIEASRVDRGA